MCASSSSRGAPSAPGRTATTLGRPGSASSVVASRPRSRSSLASSSATAASPPPRGSSAGLTESIRTSRSRSSITSIACTPSRRPPASPRRRRRGRAGRGPPRRRARSGRSGRGRGPERGRGGRHPDRRLEADPEEPGGAAHRLVHRHRRAGERPVVQPRLAVRDADAPAAERIAAVRHARRLDEVGDQRDAVRALGRIRDPHGGGMDVDAVGDQPRSQPPVGQQRAGRAGLPVPERAHGVEEVRAEREAGVGGAHDVVVRRLGVARAGDRPRAGDLLDRVEGARQLGRERHHAHPPGAQQLPQHAEVDGPEVGRVVGAAARRREEGALEVHAEDAGAGRGGGSLDGLEQARVALQRPRDRGREVGRHARCAAARG